MASIEVFKNRIIEAGFMSDPEGVHSEFASGMHGQKADFDAIKDGTPLFDEWVDETEAFIRAEYDVPPQVVIGTANGCNRLAVPVADRFDGRGAESIKDERNPLELRLSEVAFQLCAIWRPEFVLVLEDVSTTGGTSVQVAKRALAAGAKRVEVLTTMRRRPELEKLDEAGISYKTIIPGGLPTYTPDECQTNGFCAQGWQLIPHPGRSARHSLNQEKGQAVGDEESDT